MGEPGTCLYGTSSPTPTPCAFSSGSLGSDGWLARGESAGKWEAGGWAGGGGDSWRLGRASWGAGSVAPPGMALVKVVAGYNKNGGTQWLYKTSLKKQEIAGQRKEY